MVSYKLYYFNCRARAEALRMILKAAGQKFEEVNWEIQQWPEWKPKSPMGSAPWLEIDGQPFAQTVSLERHIASQYGLAGKTPLDALKCDMIADALLDLFNRHVLWLFIIKDEAHKAATLKDFVENLVPNTFKTLNNMASGGGHFVGDSLTWADIKLFAFLDWAHRQLPAGLIDNYPKLKEIVHAVESNPVLAEHIKTRHRKLTAFDP